jgi:uncharacterized membrane protein
VPDSNLLLGGMIALFVGTFVWLTWLTHARFGSFGFDLGIFDQGVWLLSRFQDPFVTIRGLPLFGDHASYILVLVAPLYWLWPDPRLLLLLQAVGLAIPAVSLYLIGTRRLHSPLAGLAVAAAYLAFPALQWAAVWSFHPETLAAGFLGLAALAADRQRWRQMAVWLLLALMCKEDVGLVVAGFGALLWTTGYPSVGRRTLAAGLGWFLLTALVLIPLANGRPGPHLELNFGITGSGPLAILYQQEIRYQYLATAAPFLALATIASLLVVARHRVVLASLLVALVAVAGFIDYRVGPAPWSKDFPRPADASRQLAGHYSSFLSTEPPSFTNSSSSGTTVPEHGWVGYPKRPTGNEPSHGAAGPAWICPIDLCR